MDEEEEAGADLQRATAGLQEGLETCQRIVSDYRSMLLSIEQPTDSSSLNDDSAAGDSVN